MSNREAFENDVDPGCWGCEDHEAELLAEHVHRLVESLNGCRLHPHASEQLRRVRDYLKQYFPR